MAKENGWTSLTMSELTHMKKQALGIKQLFLLLTMVMQIIILSKHFLYSKNGYAMKATIYLVVNRFDRSWAQDKDTKQSSQELNNEAMLQHSDGFEMLSFWTPLSLLHQSRQFTTTDNRTKASRDAKELKTNP